MSNSIRTEVINVNADVASRYLGNNSTNRAVNAVRIASYAHQMKAGQWRLNGEPVIIGKGKQLLDGQHRLMAIVSGDLTIPMLFVFNVEESSFDTINTGDSRTGGDVLSITGLNKTVADTLAGCIRTDLVIREYGKPTSSSNLTRKFTPHVIAEAHMADPRYLEAVNFVLRNRTKNLPLSVNMLSFLVYRFNQVGVDSKNSEDWVLGLMNGANLSENDPRLWIKNKVWREFAKRVKSTSRERGGYVIKAWHWDQIGRVTKAESGLYRDPMDAYKYIALDGDATAKPIKAAKTMPQL